ncbi:MAG: LD-carboxypeptidase [Deltaproteobacteria bacterium]|nr:LD-carboxypeptidase [Deltaproteobacteria bacterium]
MVKTLKPTALKKGDLIRVVASSSPFNKPHFLEGIAYLNALGFKTQYEKGIFKKNDYLAGSDKRRAAELLSALNDAHAKAILFARGGYGAMRLLPFLDKTRIKSPPKIILGYSDITVILLYLQQRYGWVGFYGPVVAKDIHQKAHPTTLKSLREALMGTEGKGCRTCSGLTPIKRGKATAPMIGGCLSLITALLGTKYEINTQGKILFLEDVGEKPYKVDRMLTQLKLAGKFDHCRGLVFGSLEDTASKKKYADAILRVLGDCPFPVMTGLKAGHGSVKMTLPLGIMTCLDAGKKSLTFMEPACND